MKEPCKKCLPLENQIVKTDEAQCLSCYLPHKIIKLLSTDECCVFEHKIKYMKGFIVYLGIAWSAIENINNVFHFNKDYSRFCLAIGDYAMALVSAGFVKLGRIFYKKGLSIIEKQELNSTTLNIFNSRYAYNFLLLDEPYKSIKLLENATAHFRKSGELWELMSATGAQNYFLVGDYEKSRFFYEEAKNIAEKLHSTLHIGWALNKVPFIDYLTGKCSAQEAEEKLKEGINLSESVHDHMTLCIHYGHLANIFTKEKDFEKSLFYAKQIMHENKVYKINIPHVKISYVDVVETIFAAFIANKISSSEKNKYEKMAKNALSKLQKLSKKNTMLKGLTLRAAAEFALLKNNKPEMEKYLIESINLLKDSPYKEEYKTSQKLTKLYNIKVKI